MIHFAGSVPLIIVCLDSIVASSARFSTANIAMRYWSTCVQEDPSGGGGDCGESAGICWDLLHGKQKFVEYADEQANDYWSDLSMNSLWPAYPHRLPKHT